MPRDGTGNYNQPFPNVASDTTIESVVYNGFTNDVALDLNAARPIIAGGTGATSADDALANIGGEKASQVVTNYDSHVWQSGSFYSTAGATGAANGNAFAGICYLLDDSGGIGIEARDNTDGKLYLRAKTAGVWGTWIPDNAEMDAEKVNRAGDTMTGSLTITGGPFVGSLHLGNTATSKVRAIRIGVDAAAPLEFINAANTSVTHTFGDDGSFSALGALSIGGSATISGRITASNEIMVGSGIIRFRNVESNYLFHTGTGYSLNGGPITVNGNIIGDDLHSYRAGAAHTGIIWLGNSGSRYFGWDGATYNLAGNVPLHVGGPIYAHTSVVGNFGVGSQIPSGLHSDGANVGIRAANSTGAVYFTSYGASQLYGYASPAGLVSLTGISHVYATAGGNSHFQLSDENGTAKGFVFWSRVDNTLVLQGAGLIKFSCRRMDK